MEPIFSSEIGVRGLEVAIDIGFDHPFLNVFVSKYDFAGFFISLKSDRMPVPGFHYFLRSAMFGISVVGVIIAATINATRIA